jgi:hypothetical protein
MPERIISATVNTWPNPPLQCPTRCWVKSQMRLLNPIESKRFPAKMKKGTARSGALVTPWIIYCGMATISLPIYRMEIRVDKPMAKETGTRKIIKLIKETVNNRDAIEIPFQPCLGSPIRFFHLTFQELIGLFPDEID